MIDRMFRLFSLVICWFSISTVLEAQSVKFSDVIIDGYQNSQTLNKNLTKTNTTTIRELVIIAVDSSATSTILPPWFDNLLSMEIPAFFVAATFSHYNFEILVLKKDSAHAFRMPYDFTPYHGDCEHVHSAENVFAVLASADSIYDFKNYANVNGVVEIHFCSIGEHNGGVAGNCFNFLTNDTTALGQRITIHVTKQTRGLTKEAYETVYYHETGHAQFDFPDTDHESLDEFPHYGLGGFDVMTNIGGFEGQPTPYTPPQRDIRGWFTPVFITSSLSDKQLQDFQMSSTCYVYAPSSLPSGTLADQKFYISYHKGSEFENRLYRKLPFPNPNLGAVLIWHTNNTGSLNKFTDFSNWKNMPIDIEAAHGKTDWIETANNVENTGIENPLTGRDKLEIRKITRVNGINTETAGPYFNTYHGDASVFYAPDDGKNFTLFTNPNSNWYSNSFGYSQSYASGFSVKNIRTSGNNVYADFAVNDYIVTSNTTLRKGLWYIYNNIIVNPGLTLTIEPGAILCFAPGTGLTVNGTLLMNGTSTKNIGLTSTNYLNKWNGITFNSGSSGSVEYCNISYALTGITCSSTLPMIRYNTISNNTIGIYVLNVATPLNEISFNTIKNNSSRGINLYSASPKIYDNTISNNGEYGINTYYSSPYLYHNTITSHRLSALNFFYYSSAKLVPWNAYGYYWGAGRNTITYNPGDGVCASYWSNLYLGSSPYGGYNRIYGNWGREIEAYYGCTVTAQLNWWGAYPPDTLEFYGYQSAIDHTNELRRDPDQPQGIIARGLNEMNTNPLVSHSGKSDFERGIRLQLEGKFDEAITAFDTYINANTSDANSAAALVRIDECYRLSGKEGISSYLQNSIRPKANKNNMLDAVSVELEAQCLIEDKRYTEAAKNYSNLASKYNNSEVEKYSLFNEGYVYLAYLKDFKKASKKFDELAAKYSDDQLVFESNYLLNQAAIESGQNNTSQQLQKSESVTPTDYQLAQNYPNPFNPTTTINYQLPKAGHVTLKIYDVLGNEVKTLVNEMKEMGRYTATFDASKLASGMYVYQIKANDFMATKKMLLLK